MTLLDDVSAGRSPAGEIPAPGRRVEIETDLSGRAGQGEMRARHDLGGFGCALGGKLPHLFPCDLLIGGLRIFTLLGDAKSAEALPAQTVEDREIIPIVHVHPLGDGAAGKALRQQAVEIGFRLRWSEGRFLQGETQGDRSRGGIAQPGVGIGKTGVGGTLAANEAHRNPFAAALYADKQFFHRLSSSASDCSPAPADWRERSPCPARRYSCRFPDRK